MADYDNTNSGVLFKNDEKDSNHPNWPDYKGNIDVEGVEYWMSAWIKTAGSHVQKPGSKFFSIALTKKDTQPESKPTDEDGVSGPTPDEGFDDIPF